MKAPGFWWAALLLGACAASRHTATDPLQQLTGRWELTLFAPGDKQFAELFGQRRPELQFNAAERRVSGTTGCNQLAGSFAVEGTAFRFSDNIALTKMACPSYDENSFLSALASVNRYSIREGRLELLRDSTLLMAFAKMK